MGKRQKRYNCTDGGIVTIQIELPISTRQARIFTKSGLTSATSITEFLQPHISCSITGFDQGDQHQDGSTQQQQLEQGVDIVLAYKQDYLDKLAAELKEHKRKQQRAAQTRYMLKQMAQVDPDELRLTLEKHLREMRKND